MTAEKNIFSTAAAKAAEWGRWLIQPDRLDSPAGVTQEPRKGPSFLRRLAIQELLPRDSAPAPSRKRPTLLQKIFAAEGLGESPPRESPSWVSLLRYIFRAESLMESELMKNALSNTFTARLLAGETLPRDAPPGPGGGRKGYIEYLASFEQLSLEARPETPPRPYLLDWLTAREKLPLDPVPEKAGQL